MKTKYLIFVQIALLTVGTLFAYYTVFTELQQFYAIEGTLFKFSDCAVTNPFLTPCFYGAFGFLAALIWSIVIYRKEDSKAKLKHQKNLLYLLVGGNLFAWGNFSLILYDYYTKGQEIGCGIVKVNSPFETACFIGASLFLLALISSIITYKRLSTQHK